ncbi:MAG: CinA family protein [Pseudomonadota bacterium]
MDPDVVSLIGRLKAARLSVVTAESCTGGLIAARLTDVSGSSAVVDRGFVTYSNEAKTEMLGVPTELIENQGAVSKEVARSMAEGALANSNASISVSVTGVAGPTGGSPEKPVGTVHFAVASHAAPTRHEHKVFQGDREAVRAQTVAHALVMIGAAIQP